MKQLIALEFCKVKRTFLTVLLPLVSVAPFILILLARSDQHNSFASAVAQNGVFIQMISFALTAITGCYIVTREFKDNTFNYLCVTPKQITKVILGKYLLLFIQIMVSQLFIFGMLIVLNSFLEGFDKQVTLRFLMAGMVSTVSFFCVIPIVMYIALLMKNFVSASLVFLFLFILTFPFSMMDYGYIFPHLLPLIIVSKLLGSNLYPGVEYSVCMLILILVFVVFFCLSLQKVGKRGE